jgi:hypothetical protein
MKKIIPILFLLSGCYYVGPNPNGPNAAFVKQPPQTIPAPQPVAQQEAKESPKQTCKEDDSETWTKVKQTAAVTAEWLYIKGKEAYQAAKESSKQ